MWKERLWPNFGTLSMGLNGPQNYMQICCYEYFQDMQGLDVTLKAKFFFFILLRHMGTGCNTKDKVVPFHNSKAHGDWM